MVTIQIIRENVYSIAEGISVTIALHNGGTPTYEQLWASADESKKLDIYYREAVSDIERKLMEWLTNSSSQFDLTADGTDYNLTLSLGHYWPTRLQGLLANKVQDYMVHAVTAGWLNDFAGLEVKQDYSAMAAQDLTDIREIIYTRSFDWEESARNADTDTKEDGIAPDAHERTADADTKEDGISPQATSRTGDNQKKEDGIAPTATNRATDSDTKEDGIAPSATSRSADSETKEDGIAPTASTRAADTDTKEDGIAPTAEKRHEEKKKNYDALPADPISRKKDSVVKPMSDSTPPLCRQPMPRHKDDAVVGCRRSDYTDWSGTDYGRLDMIPPGKPGYYNHPHPPVPPTPPVPPCTEILPPFPADFGRASQCHHPEPAPAPCHQHPSDDYSEEKYINSHECGHHNCGHHGVNPLDWGFGNAYSSDDDEELDDATFTKNR